MTAVSWDDIKVLLPPGTSVSDLKPIPEWIEVSRSEYQAFVSGLARVYRGRVHQGSFGASEPPTFYIYIEPGHEIVAKTYEEWLGPNGEILDPRVPKFFLKKA